MARVTGLALLAALALVPIHPALGQQGSPAKVSAQRAETTESANQREAEYKAARDRDEARHQLWETKMKAVTKGICTGC